VVPIAQHFDVVVRDKAFAYCVSIFNVPYSITSLLSSFDSLSSKESSIPRNAIEKREYSGLFGKVIV